MIAKSLALWQRLLAYIKPIDGIPPLLARIYLTPIMLQAGHTKLTGLDGTERFFENLGIPLPFASALLVGLVEYVGGILLLLGLATRLICVPLMATMLVAGFLAHGENGWLTLSDGNSWLANDRVIAAQEKKREIRQLMREHGDYRELSKYGTMTILNNGMEFAITYFLFLLLLFFVGGGRYTSLDYWFGNWLGRRYLGSS